MENPFIEINDLFIGPFDPSPTKGYEPPKNEITGLLLPLCCDQHQRFYENAQLWFAKFPNCCDQHKEMIGKWWFKRDNYIGLPEKIVNLISYTESLVSRLN